MDDNSNSISESYWEPVTRIVFYEPRTIPAAWDMSEFLPVEKQKPIFTPDVKDEQEP